MPPTWAIASQRSTPGIIGFPGKWPWKNGSFTVTFTYDQADQTITLLMGDDVDPRRDFIIQNAKFVKNLDI